MKTTEANKSNTAVHKLIYRGFTHNHSSEIHESATSSPMIYRGITHDRLDPTLAAFDSSYNKTTVLIYRGIRHNIHAAKPIIKAIHHVQKSDRIYAEALCA